MVNAQFQGLGAKRFAGEFGFVELGRFVAVAGLWETGDGAAT